MNLLEDRDEALLVNLLVRLRERFARAEFWLADLNSADCGIWNERIKI